MDDIGTALTEEGCAIVPDVLEASVCEELVAGFDDDARYRSTVVMERHGYGRGTYRYFAEPLPKSVAALRERFYEALVAAANDWNERCRVAERYPSALEAYLERCAAAGQSRSTPLILRYGPGDYNALHQDLYGTLAFPLQATIMLSSRAAYEGGEGVLVMQRPRAQSVARVVSLERGAALVFPNRYRPRSGMRGTYRESVRHGVSIVRGGRRFALGVIFHNAT